MAGRGVWRPVRDFGGWRRRFTTKDTKATKERPFIRTRTKSRRIAARDAGTRRKARWAETGGGWRRFTAKDRRTRRRRSLSESGKKGGAFRPGTQGRDGKHGGRGWAEKERKLSGSGYQLSAISRQPSAYGEANGRRQGRRRPAAGKTPPPPGTRPPAHPSRPRPSRRPPPTLAAPAAQRSRFPPRPPYGSIRCVPAATSPASANAARRSIPSWPSPARSCAKPCGDRKMPVKLMPFVTVPHLHTYTHLHSCCALTNVIAPRC